MKVTTFNATDHPKIEDIEKVLTDKLGDTYKYKTNKKATSLVGKMAGGSKRDSVTVIKNAYHRTVVSVETFNDHTSESGKRTNIYFSEDTLAGWLAFLNKEAGFLGRIIIRLIYGNGGGFYQEVEQVVKTNINGKDETVEVGLSTLFKKKKNQQ
ncbi:hypothetical protein [uncultured Winogradskyella sp.]|uniref:hypothetical protein n=1 Tax=uncultured Winogradskyella sp. TaxID=395353 RepID=UPI00261E50EC|nr:hypothetical protein [uncultured Winogradskyella sp.]